MQRLLDSLPKSTKDGKKIDKKLFLENSKLTATQKKILSSEIARITLQATLNEERINIAPYIDKELDFSQILVLTVSIHSTSKIKQISQIIEQIPYHLIVFYRNTDQFALSLATKRISLSDQSRQVVEETFFTKWLDEKALSALDQQFLDSITLANLPFTNLKDLYTSLISKLTAHKASDYTGVFVEKDGTKEILAKIEELETDRIAVKNQIKKSKSISEKIDLTTQLKTISDQLKSLKEQLR